MRIWLYEDRRVADLGPLTLTRTPADLLCGLTTLGEKQRRYFAARDVGHWCRPALAGMIRERDPGAAVNDRHALRSEATVLVNARWLAPAPPDTPITDGPLVGVCDGEIAFAVLGVRQLRGIDPSDVEDSLAECVRPLPACEAGGHMIRYPWELVDHNSAQIAADFDAAHPNPHATGFHPPGLTLVGPAERLYVHPTAKVDPMVVADTTNGPVWVGPGAVVGAFTRLEGPCAVGAGTHLLGAKVRGGTTLGPHCRVGGEVEASVVLGYTNKYHDGFLGHSYVGEWVNLAAGTSTADLRFDYRPVSVRVDGRRVGTGRTKVGSVIGDHARTGLNVLLDCGSTVGPFATLRPTGQLAPRDVPPFTSHGPDGSAPVRDVDEAIETADTVMRRRGRELTPALRALYQSVADPEPAAVRVARVA